MNGLEGAIKLLFPSYKGTVKGTSNKFMAGQGSGKWTQNCISAMLGLASVGLVISFELLLFSNVVISLAYHVRYTVSVWIP